MKPYEIDGLVDIYRFLRDEYDLSRRAALVNAPLEVLVGSFALRLYDIGGESSDSRRQ